MEQQQQQEEEHLSIDEQLYIAGQNAGARDRQIEHAKKVARMMSEKEYRSGHYEQIRGQRAQTEVTGHPEYVHAEKQQQNISDLQYQKKQRELYSSKPPQMTDESNSVQHAIRAQRLCRLKEEKERREALSKDLHQQAKWNGMSIEDNPIIQKKRYDDAVISSIGYKKNAREEHSKAWYEQHESPAYLAHKNVHKNTADQFYNTGAKENFGSVQYNQADTQFYAQNTTLSQNMRDYEKDYRAGRTNVTIPSDTPMLNQAKLNAKNNSNNLYKQGNEEIIHNYTTTMDTPENQTYQKNNKNFSRNHYKEGFREQIQGTRAQTDVEGHPEYVQSAKNQVNVSDNKYGAAAFEHRQSDFKGVDSEHDSFRRARNQQMILDDTKYQKDARKNNENCRGFQTMEGYDHPIIAKHAYQTALQSGRAYTSEFDEEKQHVYYPEQITERFQNNKKLEPFRSDSQYQAKARENMETTKFNPGDTDKYQQDKKLNEKLYSYDQEFQDSKRKPNEYPKGIIDSKLYQAQKAVSVNASDFQYQKADKKGISEYTTVIDTPINNQSKLNAKNMSDVQYKEAQSNIALGHRAVPDHPEYVLAGKNEQNKSDNRYKAQAGEINSKPIGVNNHHPQVKLAVQNQLNVSDGHYKRNMADVRDQNKAFLTMDASVNPEVTKHKYYAALQSERLYKEDAQHDLEQVYYPQNITQGYEELKKVTDVISTYTDDYEKKKATMKFNLAETEKYQQDKALNAKLYSYDQEFQDSKRQPNEYPKGMVGSEMYEMQQRAKVNASDAVYSKESKTAMMKNHLPYDAMTQKQNEYAQKIQSDLRYKQSYNDEVKGTRSHLPIDHHPEYVLAKANEKSKSDNAYRLKDEAAQHSYTLDPMDIHIDGPRQWAKNIDGHAYQKTMRDVNKTHKAWTTMDGHEHPITLRTNYLNALNSENRYKEDAQADLEKVYYPVNQGEHFIQGQKLQETLGGNNYYKDAKKAEAEIKLDVTETERYQDIKKLAASSGANYDRVYREGIAAGKGSGTAVAVTMEMERNAPLKEIQGQNYFKKAKELAGKYGLTADAQELAHQLKVSDITSDRLYTQGYKDNIRGKTVADQAIAYPRLLELIKQKEQLMDANYQKDAKALHRHNQTGVDDVVLKQLRENSKIIDNAAYRKSRRDVIKTMKAWQTMDASEHPLVTQSNYYNALNSNEAYLRDAKDLHAGVNYPVHITEHFQNTMKLSENLSGYENKAKQLHSQIKFDPTLATGYEESKKLDEVMGQKYTKKAAELNENPTAMVLADSEVMKTAVELRPYWSQSLYSKDAKKLAEKYHITMDDQIIANALRVNDAVNKRKYVADYQKNQVGKGPSDPRLHSYMTEKNCVEVTKQTSNALYRKEGEKIKTTGKLPLDAMEFTRIQKNAINMSDANYRKTRAEAIKTMKAWQNMDYQSHPLVTQALYYRSLNSEAMYREDAKSLHAGVNYPHQITEVYQNQALLKEKLGGANYTKAAKATMANIKFDPVQTETFEQGKKLLEVQGSAYTAKAKEIAAHPKPVAVTNEMMMSQSLAPFTKALYSRQAKALAEKYHLTMDDQLIANAISVSAKVNKRLYTADYRKNQVGKGPSDPGLDSYMTEKNNVAVSKATSEALYRKEGNKIKTTGKLPLDYMEFKRATNCAMISSDALYRKSRAEVIKNSKGWQKMDYMTHPIVKLAHEAYLRSSDALYKEDAKAGFAEMNYPVWLTEGYILAQKVSQVTSDANYARHARSIESNHQFNYCDHSMYDATKLANEVVPHQYEKKAKEMNHHPMSMKEDEIMIRAKSLAPFTPALYGRQAKKMAEKYNICMDEQVIANAIRVTDIVNHNKYLADFKKNIVGKAPTDPSLQSYMHEKNCVEVGKLTNSAAYKKEGEKIKTTGKMPVDSIEFERVQKNAKQISSALYTASYKQAIKENKYWQTMDYLTHPLVEKAHAAYVRNSDAMYKEAAKADLETMIYQPEFTEFYHQLKNLNKVVCNSSYTKEAAKLSHKTKYDVSVTDQYKLDKGLQPILNKHKYGQKAKLLAEKPTSLAETAEMKMANSLKPFTKAHYALEAKRLSGKYNITVDEQQIANALRVSDITCEFAYKKAFKAEVYGKAPADISLDSYMNEKHNVAVTKATSNALYTKAGKAAMMGGKLPLDCMEFERIRKNAMNSSDALYRKSRIEAVKQMKAWQNMDDHPITIQAGYVNMLNSQAMYKREAQKDLSRVNFPAFVTEGYEVAKKVSEATSDAKYCAAAKKIESKHNFNYADSETYEQGQKLKEVQFDHTYTKAAKAEAHKGPTEVLHEEMKMIKTLGPIWSKSHYEKDAKAICGKFNLTVDDTVMANALKVTAYVSELEYRKSFKTDVKGKAPADISLESYPQEKHNLQTAKNASSALYKMEGEKIKTTGKLPLDCMEFARIQKNALQMSDANYRKSRVEAVAKQKAWQNMDYMTHPVVVNAQKAYLRCSDTLYKEDAKAAQDEIYYPVQITEGYELAKKVSKATSKAEYEKDAKAMVNHTKFDWSQSQAYDLSKKADELMECKYKAAAAKDNHRPNKIAETEQMRTIKELSKVWSRSAYVADAKKLSETYHLTMDDQLIALALKTTRDTNEVLYRKGFRDEIWGKAPSNLDLPNYPKEEQACKASKNASEELYRKDGKAFQMTGKLPLDCIDFNRTRNMRDIASTTLYSQTRREVLKKYKGWQTMDAWTHPIVTEGERKQRLVNDAEYRMDAKEEQSWVNFPVQTTEAYAINTKLSKDISNAEYYKEAKSIESQHKFDYTTTDQYGVAGMYKNVLTGKYTKKAAELLKKPMSFETEQMKMAKALTPIWSQSQYAKAAKQLAGKYHLSMDSMQMALALKASDVTNEKLYKQGFKSDILGKAPLDPSLHSYQFEQQAVKATKIASHPAYVKEGKALAMTGKLPLDCIDFVRTRKMRDIASASLYRKSKEEVLAKFKGFQRMDYMENPIITRATDLAILNSDALYKCDAKEDLANCFFPVHFTEAYDIAMKNSVNISHSSYIKDAAGVASQNKYDASQSDYFKTGQAVQKVLNNSLYQANAKKLHQKPISLAVIPEMVRSDVMKPLLCSKKYTQDALELQGKYNLSMDVQSIAHAMEIGKSISGTLYHEDWKKNMVGKAPKDYDSYPEYKHLRAVSTATSNALYRQEGDKLKTKFHMGLDFPEISRAKQNNLNVSDAEYTKKRKDVIAKFKGWQRMDAYDHPVVVRGEEATRRISHALYTADFKEEMEYCFFPAHITPGYEHATKLTKITSQAQYKQAPYDSLDAANMFNVADTDNYKNQKASQAIVSNNSYARDAKKDHAKATCLETDDTIERSKLFKNIWSNHLYTTEAKKLQNKYGLTMDSMQMARVMKLSDSVSTINYNKDYKTNQVGKGPKNPSISYPETKHYAAVAAATSKANYVKDNEKVIHNYTIKHDYPEFLRAKQLSLLLSDAEYRKSRVQAVKDFKGFMRMDAQQHPIVVMGEKINKLFSDYHYKADWNEDKTYVFMPAHITPAYEQAKKNAAIMSSDYNDKKVVGSNEFDMSKTEKFMQDRDLQKHQLSESAYSGQAKKNFAKLTSMAEIPESANAKLLKNFWSDTLYRREANKIKQSYNLDAHDFHFKHLRDTKDLRSDIEYNKDFKKNVVGQFPKDTTIAYPEYKHLREVSNITSSALYRKEADAGMHTFSIKEDYPQFVHAAKVYKNMSRAHYRQGGKDAVKEMKGFQRMDASQHPVVTNACRIAKMQSHQKYVEDWMEEREYIYYPVHITEAYEVSLRVSKYQSSIGYSSGYCRFKYENQFKYTDTPGFKFEMKLQKQVSNALYTKAAKNEISGHRWDFNNTPGRLHQARLKEQVSNAAYRKEARKIMDHYAVDMHLPYITNAMKVNKFISQTRYTDLYRKEVGKYCASMIEDYPEYLHGIKAQNNASENAYKKANEQVIHKYTLDPENPTFKRVRAQASLMSASYHAGKREAVNTMKGFMRMDASTHPVVKKGLAAAKLNSMNEYRREYEEDKDLIYFPYTITESYEIAQKNLKNTSDQDYTKKAKDDSSKTRYNAFDTQNQALHTANAKNTSDLKYQADKVKYQGLASNSNQHEMHIFTELAPLLSKRRYTQQAKDLMNKYGLVCDSPQLVQAMQSQTIASECLYRKKYKEEVIGKFTDLKDSELIKRYCAVSDLVSDASYKKAAKIGLLDLAGKDKIDLHMAQQMDVMRLMSDNKYREGLKETLKNYSAFTRVSLEDDPVLRFQKKINHQISAYEYRKDYEIDKEYIYFPVHISPGYETATKISQLISDKIYKAGYRQNVVGVNNFNVVETPSYEFSKLLQNSLGSLAYKKEMVDNRKHSSVADDPVSLKAREVSRLVSNNLYNAEARNNLRSYHLAVDDPNMLHAKAVQALTSTKNYKKWMEHPEAHKYACTVDDWSIRFTLDQAKHLSNWRYKTDARKVMNSVKVPGDLPEFKFHAAVQEYLNPVKYAAGRYEALKTALGFTRLQVKDLSGIQQAITNQNLLSDAKYKEEYREDIGYNIYPVTITQFYDVCRDNAKNTSDNLYKSKAATSGVSNKYDFTDTSVYDTYKRTQEEINQFTYRKDALALHAKASPGAADGPVLRNIMAQSDIISDNVYKAGAMANMQTYKSDINDPKMQHQIAVSSLNSDKKYRDIIESKGLLDAVNTPAFQSIKQATQLTDTMYTRDALEKQAHITMPADTPSLNAAREAYKSISNKTYKDSMKESLKNYQGFTKLPINDLKLVKLNMENQKSLSDKVYQDDFYGWLRGNKLSVFDTPEIKQFKDAQKLLSDKAYRKKWCEDVQGKGMNIEDTPEMIHVKNMASVHSTALYEADAKENLKNWSSYMYTEMPSTMLAKAQLPMMESNYRENYQKNIRGQASGVPKLEDVHAVECSKIASKTEYRKDYDQNQMGKTTGWHTLPENRESVFMAEQYKTKSDALYHEKWNQDKSKVGSMADSYLIKDMKRVSKDVSEWNYRHASPLELDKYKGYFRNILDTPAIRFQYKAKEWFSQTQYTKEWNEDKNMCFYPYWLTAEYQHNKKLKTEISPFHYTKKARNAMDHPEYQGTKNVAEVRCREVRDLASEVCYKKKHNEERGKKGFVEVAQAHAEHHKDVMSLISMAAEQVQYRKIADQYNLDIDSMQFVEAKRKKELSSKVGYEKDAKNKLDKNFYQGKSRQDFEQEKLRDLNSDVKYKQDLFLSKGHVTQISDEPWVKHHKDLQACISGVTYPSPKRISKYLPEKWIKHVAKVMETVSNVKYQADYLEDLKGNLYPTYDRPDFTHYKKMNKLTSTNDYKRKALQQNTEYTPIADSVPLVQAVKAAEQISDLNYRQSITKESTKGHDEACLDTPAMRHSSNVQDVISEEYYKRHAKRDIHKFTFPPEGDKLYEHVKNTADLASVEKYTRDAKHNLEHRICDLREDMNIQHQLSASKNANIDDYQRDAKSLLHHNEAGVTPFIQKQMDAQKMVLDKEYTAGYEQQRRDYKPSHELITKQTKHSQKVSENISNLEYDSDFKNMQGVCFGVPMIEQIRKQTTVQKLASNNNYKQKVDDKSGLNADALTFETSRIASTLADSKYRTADIVHHKYNPEKHHAKDCQDATTDANYRVKLDEQEFSVVLDTPELMRLKEQKKHSDVHYRTRPKDMFKGINESVELNSQRKAQKGMSDAEYKDDVQRRPAFATMGLTPIMEHNKEVSKMQSNAGYRQVEHTGLNFETAEMRKAREASDLASKVKYRQDNRKFTATNESMHEKHLREQRQIQSNENYKRTGKGRQSTVVNDDANMAHFKDVKNLASNNSYKKKSGNYTYSDLDTPAFQHYAKANNLSSDLQYKNQSVKNREGSGWFPEESPSHAHFTEAQAMMHSKDYRGKAARAMHNGGEAQIAGIDGCPSIKHAKYATDLVSDVSYRQKPKSMFSPMDTPAYQAMKYAERIKSGTAYRADYEADMAGKACIGAMDTPEMAHARAQKEIRSEKAYRQKYEKEMLGRAAGCLDTPAMRTIKKAQSQVSDKRYRTADYSHQASMLDTPEMRRIKQNSKQSSDIAYKNEARDIQARVTSAVMDTPFMNTVKRNSQNTTHSVHYQKPLQPKSAACLDMVSQRACQVAKMQSNVSYRGVDTRRDKMESIRETAVNHKPVEQYAGVVRESRGEPVGSQGERMMKGTARNSRYRSDPGSIFDFDPTMQAEEEARTQKRSRPSNRRQYTDTEPEKTEDDDYLALMNYKTLGEDGPNRTAKNWMNYLQGEYKAVHPANHVSREREGLDDAVALVNLSKAQIDQAREAAVSASREEEARMMEASQNQQTQQSQSRLNLQSYGYTTDFSEYESGYNVDDTEVSCTEGDMSADESFKANTFVAMYNFQPTEEDELTMQEGDMIDECQFIGEGWLYGYNRRSGEAGMLPANYVESNQL